jgi:histidinol dehydrogenase
VGIDGFYGPSDVLVVATAGADPALIAADLLAQAEHGTDSLSVCVSPDAALLDAIAPLVTEAIGPISLVEVPDAEAALAFAEHFAPEHLELQGQDADMLAPRVRSAGCLFVGDAGGTAFGDYVAGSNHSLPTGGSARFASGLSARAFRRRMSEVHVDGAAAALAAAGAPIARAEGFEAHATSMEARLRLNQERA